MDVNVREWPCWEITRCTKEDCCLDRRYDVCIKPCWEIANELDDYRSAMNVCKDCIVYVTKEGASLLSEEELAEIVGTKKVECVLVNKCPNYTREKDA
ncbi:MAG: hypothetical protein ACOY8P_06090 [Thermodesulfobacteriota bacterium]